MNTPHLADQPTDFFLIQATFATMAQRDKDQKDVIESIQMMSQMGGTAMVMHRIAAALEQPTIYFYLKLPSTTSMDTGTASALAMVLGMTCEAAIRISRLQLALQPVAHSKHETPKFHYVVETDSDEGWFDKITDWYDQEHMPGLAAVPGTVSAMRLVNHDARLEEKQGTVDNRPCSFACYDLTDPDVLTSPAWLAVRHTAWSDISRPHFKNTLRTMMRIIG
jgi:hypothetical protein